MVKEKTENHHQEDVPAAVLVNPRSSSPLVLACEHASNYIPARYHGLSLEGTDTGSHAAWDIGAQALARKLSKFLNAPLVESRVSRLVYDCNRAPGSEDAIPDVSEVIHIPGNHNLTAAEIQERIESVYQPFATLLADTIRACVRPPVLVTVHSFTPIYFGNTRACEIGAIHHQDDRLAKKIVALADSSMDWKCTLNEPYSQASGVTHTLEIHGTKNGLINVMLEVRNDLLATTNQQDEIAAALAKILQASLLEIGKEIMAEEYT